MMTPTPAPKRQRSLRARVMQIVVPVVMGTFVVIGLLLLLAAQNQTRAAAIEAQKQDLDGIAREIDRYMQDAASDLRALAASRSARDFAQDTLLNVSSNAIAESQGRLLRDMTLMLERRPGSYLRTRYITYTGSVWSEVDSTEGAVPVADDRIRLNMLRGDLLLEAARVVPTGTVLGGDISFVRDASGATLPLIRLATPVSTENDPTNLAGVLEVNILATPVLETLQRAALSSNEAGESRRYLLVDAQNQVLIDTSSADIALFNLLTEGRGVMLDESDPALQARLDGATGPLQAVSVGSGKFRLGEVVSSAEIALSSDSAPYFRVFVLAGDASAGAVNLPSIIIVLASLLAGVLLCGTIFVVLGRVLGPMQALAEQAARGAAAPAPSAASDAPLDEVGQLSAAFAALANETAQLRGQLSEQSERYRRNLEVTARVGRETAAMYDLDALLNRAINLISTEYGFYHAQVFLIDDVGRNAVLVYSTGEAGRELLRRKHKLAVGSESLVGLVASTGQPQVVNDTQEPGDVPWRFNPLLPETRGEMALPLQVGDQAIGVLDVQSRQPNRFDARDLQTFQLLSDQIALAVQNARLVQQTDERVAQIDTLNRQLTREAWRESQQQSATSSYSYDLLALNSPEAGRQIVPAEPAAALETPIIVRGEVIGTLSAAGERYSENDLRFMKAVADRVAVALENARLFSEAQTGRRTLFTILETLPAGVLVLDALTFRPLQANAEAETLLGRSIRPDEPFSIAGYGVRRFGSADLYPEDDLPIYVTARTGNSSMVDDVSVTREDSDVNLVLNTAPIRDARGGVTAVVAAFQDITVMRVLETSLQSTLQETITLYETTRAFAEAEETGDVLDQVIAQLASLEAADIQVVLLEQDYAGVQVARSQSGETGEFSLPGDLLDPAEPVLVSDTALDGRTALASALQARGLRAAASMPLMARARREVPLGWLVLLFNTPQPLEDRLNFLSTLSDSAAVAIDNRNLFRSTEEALQQTAAIYNATTAISRAQTLAGLGDALRGAAAALQPDVIAAYLRAQDDTLVPLLAPVGADEALDEAIAHLAQGQEQRALFLDDLEQGGAPAERAFFDETGLRALGIAPLRDGGLIFIGYHQPHRFSSGDARYLSALADSTSVVSSNLNLLEQVQSALQETSILYEASRALANARTVDEILAATVQQWNNTPITTAIVMALVGPAWDAPRVAGRVEAFWQRDGLDLGLAGVTLAPDEFPLWPLLSTPEPLVISDIQTAELDEMQLIALETLDLRALLVLPLRSASRPIGALVLGASEMLAFSERDLRIFGAFAEQASIRIEAARLLQQTERRARQLSTNAEVSQITSSILNMTELLPRLVEDVKNAFGYDHVQIFLMDEADDYAVLRASTGEVGAELLARQHRLQKGSRSVIGQVTALGRPVIAGDTALADVVHRPNPLLPYTRAEMAIPLLVKGRVVGALDVQSNRPNAFDADDVNVLTALAGQVAIAIDNAELFDASRQTASNMSMLFRVSNAAAAGETLADSVTAAAATLRDALGALCVSVYLPERYLDSQDNLLVIMRPAALAGSDLPLSEVSEVNLADEAHILSRAVRSGEPLELADIAQQGDYMPIDARARAVLILPLMSGSEAAGVVVIERSDAGAFDADTRAVLLTLRGSLAVVVQNKELLEQVQRTNSQLLELDRMKSDFLANMSHELRTPLNSIIGFSKVILKGIDGPLTEMQEQDLSTIYSSGVHLLNLINDILDQAKITAGKMDLQLAYFDMKNVVDAVRSIGIGLVKDKPIQILAEMAPGLPKAYGDEFRTRQVMLNLVSNAAKFTREGSITIRAYPVQDAETGRLVVRTDVIDTGIGIAEKDLPLLFEAFRQVDSSLTRTVGGTGLGLPIAKSLVEMQNGQILVDSQLNVGSTFSILMPTGPQEAPPSPELDFELPASVDAMKDTIILPRLKPKSKTQELPPSPRRETLETDALNPRALPPVMLIKRQVLLIEDVPENVDSFRRALQREGYEVFAASIPLEAEAMASGLRPTLIVMSAEFGGGGAAWDILTRLKGRDDTLDIPVIVVSSGDDEARAQQAGAFALLRRPYFPDALLRTVQQAEQESRIERILIVDDQPESVRLLEDILAEQGRYRVFSAASAMEGISMVARRRPNLILLDLRLPDMDGLSVIRELRMNPETANIPIVVVTADSLSADEQTLLKSIRVLYKHDLSNGKRVTLLDEVNSHLQQAAGG